MVAEKSWNKMSTNEDKEANQKDGEQGKATEISIKVDRSEELKDLQSQLKKAEEEKVKAIADLQTKADELKGVQDEKKSLEDDKGDLEAKMQLIAEAEFVKKREILVTKAKELFRKPDGTEDEEKVKKLQDQLTQDDSAKATEALKMNQYLIGHLETALVDGAKIEADAKKAEAEKKAKDAKIKKDAGTEQGSDASGQLPLSNDEQTGVSSSGDPEGWDSHHAMIADLRRRARDPKDPEKQAEAQAQLNELWKKWAKTVRKDYDQGKVDYKPEKQKTIRKLHREGI